MEQLNIVEEENKIYNDTFEPIKKNLITRLYSTCKNKLKEFKEEFEKEFEIAQQMLEEQHKKEEEKKKAGEDPMSSTMFRCCNASIITHF